MPGNKGQQSSKGPGTAITSIKQFLELRDKANKFDLVLAVIEDKFELINRNAIPGDVNPIYNSLSQIRVFLEGLQWCEDMEDEDDKQETKQSSGHCL